MINSLNSSLDSANASIGTALARLSSGFRINSTKDDPAGLQIASQMGVQISSAAVAMNNIADGLSSAETAGGGLGQASETLQRMRELAVQSGNGTYSASDRQAIQAEFSQLSSSLDTVSRQTQFNGQNLLDGTFSTSIQTGPNSGDKTSISYGNVSASALGFANADISTAAGSQAALAAIDEAMVTVDKAQANVGATQAALDSSSANLGVSNLNLSASHSAIADANYAQASSDQVLAGIRQQSALKTFALYNANQANILSLLPGQTK